MKKLTKLIAVAIVAGTAALGASTASAWWGGNDYWGGPWGYPGYGYGGYPGYGYGGYGYGGYPGYGYGGYGYAPAAPAAPAAAPAAPAAAPAQ